MTLSPANRRRLRGSVLPLLALIAWEAVAHRDAAHAAFFVPLEDLPGALAGLIANGDLVRNWSATFVRTLAGIALGAGVGLALGAIMAVSRLADRLVNPLYHTLRQVPLLGWIPLISLLLGNGPSSKLFVVALAAFYPAVLNSYEGLRQVDPRYLDVSAVFRLNRWQLLRRVRLPAALPFFFTGLMQAVAFAWVTSVAAEFFFNPGPGLGNLMLNAQAAFRMDIVLLSVVLITLTGFATNWLLARLARRALRWRETR